MAQAPLLSLIFIYGWLSFAGATFFACLAWSVYLFMQPAFTGLLFIVPFVMAPFAFAQIVIAVAAYRGSQGARRTTEVLAGILSVGLVFVGGPIMLIMGPGTVLVMHSFERWPVESVVLMGYPLLVALSIMHAFRKETNGYFLELAERKRAPQPYWHVFAILLVLGVSVVIEQVLPSPKTVDAPSTEEASSNPSMPPED